MPITRTVKAPAEGARKARAPRSGTTPQEKPQKPAQDRTEASQPTSGANGQPPRRPKLGGNANTPPPSSGGGLWGIEDEMCVRFLSEPEPTETNGQHPACPANAAMMWYRSWWDNNQRIGGILEEGENPPDGLKATVRWLAAVIDRADDSDSPRIKYLRIPNSLMPAIKAQFKRYGTICDVDAFFSKTGKDLKTKYGVTFDREQSKTPGLARMRREMDIEAQLLGEWERMQGMEPQAPNKLTKDDLDEMDQPSFVALAKKMGLTISGKKRSQVTVEILEAQEDED